MSDVTPKIKAVLLVVALLGAFAAYLLFDSAKSIARRGDTLGSSLGASLALPDNDKDADGLSDTDESLWNTDFQNPDSDNDGFLDGEEIASGHDPATPGPDDQLDFGGPLNLTERVSDLVLAGLQEGSLKPDDPRFAASLNAIADEITTQALLNSLPNEDLGVIQVENNPRTRQEYRNFMEPFLSSMLSTLQFTTEIEEDDTQALTIKREEILGLITRLAGVPVPKPWVQLHENLLKILQDIERNYFLLERLTDDGLQRLTSLGALIDIFSNLLPELLYQYGDAFRSPEASL